MKEGKAQQRPTREQDSEEEEDGEKEKEEEQEGGHCQSLVSPWC